MTATAPLPARRGLPTSYAGHVFRSRLEARFAVLFDAMGIRWEYEPEGFELPHGLYVPDFWLPDLRTWFEVKPDWDDVLEAFWLTADLSRATGQAVCVAPGLDVKGWGFPVFHVWRGAIPERIRPSDGELGYFGVDGERRVVVARAREIGEHGPTMQCPAYPGTAKAKAATFERPDRIPAYPLVVR